MMALCYLPRARDADLWTIIVSVAIRPPKAVATLGPKVVISVYVAV
jgi:hypothetical protein